MGPGCGKTILANGRLQLPTAAKLLPNGGTCRECRYLLIAHALAASGWCFDGRLCACGCVGKGAATGQSQQITQMEEQAWPVAGSSCQWLPMAGTRLDRSAEVFLIISLSFLSEPFGHLFATLWPAPISRCAVHLPSTGMLRGGGTL